MSETVATVRSVSIALCGSGGAGVITTGTLLLDAAADDGWYGLQTRTVGPQIRGGESAALIRLATMPVSSHDDQFHILAAVDWNNVERFAAELPLGPDSIIITDPKSGPVPDVIAGSEARVIEVPLKQLAATVTGGRSNMVALGVIAELVGIPEATLAKQVDKRLARKGADAVAASLAAMAAGRAAVAGQAGPCRLAAPDTQAAGRWLISGNQAAALGGLRGGVRFAAAYPITPATDMLEWLAGALPKVGGRLLQAEDELASINMALGAAFGGVPAMTATAGPGLALMLESLGMAVATETPVVVVDVMRGGPSTGIPTKTEQSDLNMAVYGLHGDAPHLVLAPQSVEDCLATLQWSVHLAEALQTPAIVLSDQFLGQARAVIDPPADLAFVAARKVETHPSETYRRYALTADGVSPVTLPGTPGGQFVAESLEHTEDGRPASQAEHHISQLEKRRRKLDGHDYGTWWATIEGDADADLAVICWGSVTGVAREALMRARADGVRAKLIAPRLLAPIRPKAMAAALKGVRQVLVVEQTHGGQFHKYLRAHYDLPGEVRSFCVPGPLMIQPGEIHELIGRRQ